MSDRGAKHDDGKPRWDLLPYDALTRVVDVMTFGAAKYAPRSWQSVPEAHDRYFAAAMRHLTAWFQSETKDPESGLPHLAHATCCILFLLSLEEKTKNDTPNLQR